jgi:hypothetical protein
VRAGALALTLTALAAPAALGAQEHETPASPQAGAVPDRVIVVWEPGVPSTDRVDARDDADATLVRTLGDPQFQLLRTEAGQSVGDALATLRDDPAVRVAARDDYSVPHASTNDPLFNQEWGLQNLGLGVFGVSGAFAVADADVDAQRAWNRTRGSAAVVIADLDSGYRFDHPDLAPVAWSNPLDPQDGVDNDRNGIVDDSHGADFVGTNALSPSTDGDPTDDDLQTGGHGVHTAGTMGAAGNDGVGITGVAQGVRIMPLRVCAHSNSTDASACPASAQVAAINYAGAHGARAANMSLGGTTFNAAVRDAFASNPRTLFVISAGNDAQDNEVVPHYPCAYDPTTSRVGGAIDNVVCVAATDQADGLASFSDWGARSVDLAAPGTETLSTYVRDLFFGDTFTVDDFAASWQATGPNGGFMRTSESPLTSFGMSDSPGAAPAAGSVRESTSAPVTLPPGYSTCRLKQTRTVSLGGGTYTYSVLLNGASLGSASPSSSGTFSFDVSGASVAAGGSLQLRFRYTAGPSPTGSDGVWLDNVSFACIEPVGSSSGYGLLDGTSMAAPHVTGAAGLLFSLAPGATVAQVRAALLASAEPKASLTGRTVTGGRLNVADALQALVPGAPPPPPETQITAAPPATTTANTVVIQFDRIDEFDVPSFECRLDGGAFQPCVSPASVTVPLGIHAFAVRALDERGVADPSPSVATWTVVPPLTRALPQPPPQPPSRVVRCTVPRLKGLTLTGARRALSRAHCKLGRVAKPRARRGRRLPPLAVRSSTPGKGAVRAEGARVKVTLGPKPRARRRQARRRR